MREKLESLNLATLKDLAKHKVKGSSTMKKADLIEALLELEEGGGAATQGGAPAAAAPREETQAPQPQSRRESHGHHHPMDDFNEQPVPADALEADGILEVMQDGFGFIRCENFLPGENDVYVAPGVIRRFNLKTGDMLNGATRGKTQNEKFGALIHLNTINGYTPEVAMRRANFEHMTPIFPDEKLTLETPACGISMRIMDLICPIGKGQRGMIVSPPKAGKTTLLKEVAKSIRRNYPDIHLIVLLIDERPEEVTDIKEFIQGPNAEVIYSTFDELPEHHKRVSEMVIERARRLVEHKQDVMILLDSITRLARAYNQVIPPSGRTLSGGLDPAALHMPKRFFGAARNMREGGSLTILATALIETGSKMDDVVYEEFKGTGNMEMILDRKLQERRVFPAINIPKSSTRREDLLLTPEELDAVNRMRKSFNSIKSDDAVDQVISLFTRTRNNRDFVHLIEKQIL
ncbi:MAG: transcription termination factor Rho [Lachnospiraceae bacterium]|nr:transcription termination factor Rho [Lachnospiraceae bacterium]